MSDFLALQDEVQDLVARPDKVALIQNKINAAIRLVSSSGRYWRDVQEVTLTATDGIDPSSSLQNISLPLYFRFPTYITYPTDISTCGIEIIPFNTIIHPDYRNKENIAYCSGSNLLIKNTTLTTELGLGYYSYQPKLILDTDTNWVTEFLPDLIVDLAAAYVATVTGDSARSKEINNLFNAQLAVYLQDVVAANVPGV